MKNRTKSKFLMILIVRQHLQGLHFRNMTIMLSLGTLKLMCWSPRSNGQCESPSRPPMQNFPNYIKLEGEQTFIILEELKELQFKKKKNILAQCYLIFTSSTLCFLTNIPIINERVSIFFFVSFEKNHWRTIWCCEMCQMFKITRGNFRRWSTDVWWDIRTEMWRILWWWNKRCKWNNDLYKGLLSFTIVGLKENVPYIIKSAPERNTDGKWNW